MTIIWKGRYSQISISKDIKFVIAVFLDEVRTFFKQNPH